MSEKWKKNNKKNQFEKKHSQVSDKKRREIERISLMWWEEIRIMCKSVYWNVICPWMDKKER